MNTSALRKKSFENMLPELDPNSSIYEHRAIGEVQVLRFAKKLHSDFESFTKSSEKLVNAKNTSGMRYKMKTSRFLNYLNQSSLLLQQLGQKLKQSNKLIYSKVRGLLSYLHKQLDVLRMLCFRLLNSKVAIKYQFVGIVKNVNKCVCL